MRVYDNNSIKRLRESVNLGPTEFGRRIGIRRQQVTQLEEGNGKPNVKTLERIMNAYDVDETYFFKSKSNCGCRNEFKETTA